MATRILPRSVITWALGLGLCASSMGCAPVGSDFPPAPYFETCTSDLDCEPDFQCLPWSTFGTPRMVCTLPCTTEEECPRVVTQHCGDGTICEESVCGFFPCR